MTRLWYVLVRDDGTKINRVSSIVLSPVINDIDDICTNVKETYADSYLRGVPPDSLLVYRNKTAFDNRIQEGDDGLTVDLLLVDLETFGKNMDDPLYVCVPDMGQVISSNLDDYSINDRYNETFRAYTSISNQLGERQVKMMNQPLNDCTIARNDTQGAGESVQQRLDQLDIKQKQRVWYTLVDDKGDRLERFTESFVFPSDYDLIADFCVLLKREFGHSYLKGVPPDSLLVYRNKTAFDNRTLEGGTEKELSRGFRMLDLGTFGKNVDDPLYVCVPDLEHVISIKLEDLNINSKYKEAYEAYTSIANQLSEKDQVQVICQQLNDITKPRQTLPDDSTPFVFLVGSSGVGKTQMAFNIMANLKSHKCFYFLFRTPRERPQPIYCNFKNISRLFEQCTDKDYNELVSRKKSPSCDDIFEEKLFIFGFIYSLVKLESFSGDLKVKAKTGGDVAKLLRVKYPDHNPIFIIDECISTGDHKGFDIKFMFRMVRNCFRCLGLGLVLLGTDSIAAELPSNIHGFSRRDENIVPWCYIYGDFPKVETKLLKLPENTPAWVESLCEMSRPWFARLIREAIKKNYIDADRLFQFVFERATVAKDIFGLAFGALGQIRLFLNAHYTFDLVDSGVGLIDSHFAQLKGDKNIVLLTNGKTKKSNEYWCPASAFPPSEEDLVLYLVFMGGKNFNAFDKLPYAAFYKIVYNKPEVSWNGYLQRREKSRQLSSSF